MSTYRTLTPAILMAASIATAFAADPSSEESGSLAEVIVTATKSGATDLQKTPIAVTSFDAQQLNELLASNIKDIAARSPNLQVSQAGTNAIISIRGIGSNNVYAGSDPDVTMQVDGVYVARPSGQFADFLDVDRVEVLRGPQGTLYGRNAVGGTINIVSRAPTDTFAAREVLTVGNYGLVEDQAYLSGPLVAGVLQGSVSANYIRHNNYEPNVYLAGPSGVDNANRGGLRVQLRFEPTSNLVLMTRADWSEIDENLQSYDHLLVPFPGDTVGATIVGNYHRVAIDAPQNNLQVNKGISEEISWHIDDHYTLKSLSAYRSVSFNYNLDTDDTPLNVNFGRQAESEKEASQEFNLSVNYSRFSGVVGAYLFYESEASLNQVFIPNPGVAAITVPDVHTRSGAVFAQGSYEIVAGLKATVGGRYTVESKTLDANFDEYLLGPDLAHGGSAPGFPAIFSTRQTYHAFTPKFGLDWQLDPNFLLYISATRGYKSGGDNYAAFSLTTATFAPEYIWSYEAGFKSEWLDHRLRANVTAFYYNYKDLQVQNSIAAGVDVIGNAATANVKGLEGEFTAQLTRALRVDANAAFLNARYTTFNDASVPVALGPFLVGSPQYNAAAGKFNASGNFLDRAPKGSGSLGARYDWHLGEVRSVFVRSDLSYQSRSYFDPSNALIQSQSGYSLLSASLGFEDQAHGWQAELWAKNITDRQYAIAAASDSLAPTILAGPPRTFGVRLGIKW